MALPLLATVGDFGEWIDQTLEPDDPKLTRWLRAASGLVRRAARQTWVDENGDLTDVPDDVVAIVLQCVERKWNNPTGVASESTGPFSVKHPDMSAEGLYLTEDEKELLAGYRPTSGLWSLRTDKDDEFLRELVKDTVFVPDASGGDPIPWETSL